MNAAYNAWYFKANEPGSQQAIWLRFSVLASDNGFHRVAETWAVFSERNARGEIAQVAAKQTHPIEELADTAGVRIGDCELAPARTRGSIQCKGQSIEWDLQISSASGASAREDLRVSGNLRVNGQAYAWTDAFATRGRATGKRAGHSWVWGHCNSFVDESGRYAPFVFEGLTARSRIVGPVPGPRVSSFYFRYQGNDYVFRSMLDAFRIRSRHSLTEWEFQADRGDLSFRGEARAQHRDFAGLTYEDTNGSLLYCAGSRLSDMRVHVYRRGKLESSFTANGTAAFEIVSRRKNPYVPSLI